MLRKQKSILKLFIICAIMINYSTMAGDFESFYHGPTKIIQGSGTEKSRRTENKQADGDFTQHFYGPTTIIKPDGEGEPTVGKRITATTAPEALPVNAAPDLVLIEEFVKRGLVQKIRDGSLSLTGSSAFLELKSSLGPKPLACGKPSNRRGNQKKH